MRPGTPIRGAWLTVALTMLAGCGTMPAVGPDYAGPPASAAPPARWQTGSRADVQGAAARPADNSTATAVDAAASAAAEAALRDWWAQFDDPLLAGLVSAAQGASSTIEQAALRIAQARSELTAAQANALPAIGASGNLTRSAITFAGPPILQTLVQVQAQASWEIDLFGGLARGSEAAVARVLARQASWQDARAALAAEVANAYIGLRHCERQVVLTGDDARSRAETARLTELTGRAGLQAPATVALAQASSADAANRLVQQRTACELLVKSLVVLTALEEPALREALAASTARLPVPRLFEVDRVPARVLAQRPDLAALERELAAASAAIGQAEAARYPSLSLAGSVGPLRVRTDGVTLSTTTWSIGPALTLPLYDGGRRVANVEAAKAGYRAAETTYTERVRIAVREVEEAMLRLASADERETHATTAAQGYRQALEAAQSRFEAGLGSLVELEDARRTSIQADTASAELLRDRVLAWVALYRAIGGGWNEPTQPTLSGAAR